MIFGNSWKQTLATSFTKNEEKTQGQNEEQII